MTKESELQQVYTTRAGSHDPCSGPGGHGLDSCRAPSNASTPCGVSVDSSVDLGLRSLDDLEELDGVSNSQAILNLGQLLIKLEKDREHEKAQPPKVQVNEVISLRSGKKVDNKVTAPPAEEDSDVEIIFDEKEELEKEKK
ncbi:hypothetical protein L2E82_29707 [Cichorium intybus]|uniref:Uncharacterized protein n=1 Tax=Cichorium intybus TaxID=13427 RepID=A0ACB9CY98_CICIN|nr:hypothetical protein L2E82_29707 [Cichorium intybus]